MIYRYFVVNITFQADTLLCFVIIISECYKDGFRLLRDLNGSYRVDVWWTYKTCIVMCAIRDHVEDSDDARNDVTRHEVTCCYGKMKMKLPFLFIEFFIIHLWFCIDQVRYGWLITYSNIRMSSVSRKIYMLNRNLD